MPNANKDSKDDDKGKILPETPDPKGTKPDDSEESDKSIEWETNTEEDADADW